jgi:hypothetical protein
MPPHPALATPATLSPKGARAAFCWLVSPQTPSPGRWPLQLCQTEVQHLRLAACRHKDIGRLDVVVSDALRVRRIQPIGNLDGEIEEVVNS